MKLAQFKDSRFSIYSTDFNFNSEDYRNRKWDMCSLSLSELCDKVSIERSNIQNVLDQLSCYQLIERIEKWTKVYLRPDIEMIDRY